MTEARTVAERLREIADSLGHDSRTYDLRWAADEFDRLTAALTSAHAAGKVKGREEAARIAEGIDQTHFPGDFAIRQRIASAIRSQGEG